MFGFVRPAMGELRLREARVYRAFYCGVCKGLGRQCGPVCRAFLQYDFALLALVLDQAYENKAGISPGRCCVNPLRRLPMAAGQALHYACDAHGILLLGKALDDRRDGGAAALLAGPLAAMSKKACAARPALRAAMDRLLADQSLAEEKNAQMDEAAEPFAVFCQEMFAPEDAPGQHREALRYLGYNLGRWIYFADALQDLERDRKKRRFNPLLPLSRQEAADFLPPVMHQCAQQALAAFDLLPEGEHGDIARNILELGLFFTAQEIVQGNFAHGVDAAQRRGETL